MSISELPHFHGITLYSHNNDYQCHSTRLILAEKGIQYRLILVEDSEIEDLTQINPYGSLPALVDPQTKLYHQLIINEYIDDRYRQNRLFSDAPAEKAQQKQLLWRIHQDWFKYADQLLRHPEQLSELDKKKAEQELQDVIINLSRLFQHSNYFMSDQFSILDCSLAPLLLRLPSIGISLSGKHSKALLLYCKRVFNRDSFKQSMTQVELSRYSDYLKLFNN